MTLLVLYALGYVASCILFLALECRRPWLAKEHLWVTTYSLAWPIWAGMIGSEKAKRWHHSRKRRIGK